MSNVKMLFSNLGLLAVSIILSACTVVKSDVSRFDRLPGSVTGSSYFVLPYKNQKGSAEFSYYANSISRRMNREGFRKASDLKSADYLVRFSYGVPSSKQVTTSTRWWRNYCKSERK